jgi:hypothetical protein
MGTRKKSRPLSKSEGFGIIAEYFRSGMSCVKFYRSHSISEWQFYRWKRLYLRVHPEVERGGKKSEVVNQRLFSPIEIKDPPLSIPISFPALEIHYPSGIILRIASGFQDVSQIERLIHQ